LNAFVLPFNVQLYGGFNGTEQQLSERNWGLHKTVLSGDLAGNDDALDPMINRSDNSQHVLIIAGEAFGAAVDGFTVTGGNANGTGLDMTVFGETIPAGRGGGMVIANASPAISHMVFAGNSAVDGGGLAI